MSQVLIQPTSLAQKVPSLNKENGQLTIEKRSDGRVWVRGNGKDVSVNVKRCFPWSKPDRWLSLRDEDENEIALIANLDDLDASSREAIGGALAEAGFVLEIVGVDSIVEDFEIRSWNVRTRQGERRFQTKLDDFPYEVPGGGLLIKDIAGDLFYLSDPGKLDVQSRKVFWAFME